LRNTALEQRRQAKLQWLQHQNQSNVDNLNNVRRENVDISGGREGKKKEEEEEEQQQQQQEYLKAGIDEL
jgi:hypothetical protein